MKKKILMLTVSLILSIAVAGCGNKETEEPNTIGNEVVETAAVEESDGVSDEENIIATDDIQESNQSEQIVTNSMEMYEAFLAGEEKLYTENTAHIKRYSEQDYDMVPYYAENDGLLISEFLSQVVYAESREYENASIDKVSYCYIDCGKDGELELILRADLEIGYDETSREFVIKNIDGKLQLCEQLEQYYRSSAEIVNSYGLVYGYSSYGIASTVNTVGIVDGNGKYHRAYSEEISYDAGFILDERFGDIPERIQGEDLFLTCLSTVDYDSSNPEAYRNGKFYSAEKPEDEPTNGVDIKANQEAIQAIFDEVGMKLYTRDEIEQMKADREKELGLDDIPREEEQLEWVELNIDLKGIDSANNDAEASSEKMGQLSLIESSKDKNMITFEIQEMLCVTPEDTELIEEYGLEPDLDGYDYEFVNVGEAFVANAFKSDCTFEYFDYENMESHEASGDEFCAALIMEGYVRNATVYYTIDEDGFLTSVREIYVP